MNIFYEESGQFKVAAIVQKSEASYQADTLSGKRSKVKAANVFFEFDGALEDFLTTAQALAKEIDIDLLWESCGEEEFGVAFIAEEYFGHTPSKSETAAVLMALYAAPAYFYKKGKGIFKAAPAETLKQALAAIARKEEQEALQAAWAAELEAFRLPEALAPQMGQILFAPDKQSPGFKAFELARQKLKKSPQEMALALGLYADIPAYLLAAFLAEHFPKGVGFADIGLPEIPALPRAEGVKAYSVDDADTTEIDDALSLTDLGGGRMRVGIHIAAPGVGVAADSAVEKLVLSRLSTVYFPGGKITMLPETWIGAYSLDEGGWRPSVSLYADVDSEGVVQEAHTKIEAVWIEKNLRLQEIEPLFNENVGTVLGAGETEAFPFQRGLGTLLALAKKRQALRGQLPAVVKQFDYFIILDDPAQVRIGRRERNSPLDTVVSEMMILANSFWAEMLDKAGVGGIFRVQPAGKVRMSTKSEPHIGLGLQHYAWFTSPLRRATDIFNQRQLLHCLEPERYPLRFEANAIELMALLREFESRYTAYADFQRDMEAYWSLVYLQQQDIREITATAVREDWVRLDGLPMGARANGIPICAPRSRVVLKVSHIDLSNQSVSLSFLRFAHEAE